MGLLKKLFGGKEAITVTDYASFWNWFTQQEQKFFGIVKSGNQVDSRFLSVIMPQLQQLNSQFYCLTGMFNEEKAELVITPEGDVKNFVFAENLVAAAPALKNWVFTALKPATGLDGMQIEMDGYQFNNQNIHFFPNINNEYPDEIDITMIHRDYNEADKDIIANGTLIYLDNALGELHTATLIDSIKVTGPSADQPDIIPVAKLKDYLTWREKEFIEKYKGTRRDTEHDQYNVLEAEDENGLPVLAIINSELLNWDAKASHPWMMLFEIRFDGLDNNGFPDEDTYKLMNEFEDEIMKLLKDTDGYLNLGRETHNNVRSIYFACKEFRKASTTAASQIDIFRNRLNIKYEIYKDKYWISMNRFS